MAGQLMVDTSSESQASDLDVDMFIKGIVNICEMDEDNVSATVAKWALLHLATKSHKWISPRPNVSLIAAL